MILYFTGTGNSKFAADVLAEELNEQTISLNEVMKKGESVTVESDRPIVIVSPVYAWRLPRVVEDQIRKIKFSGDRDIYFVVTMGNDPGGCEKYCRKLCEKRWFEFKGFCGIRMEVPEAYYDYARPGVILYGCYPSDEVHPENLDIKPVMQVKANLVKVKDVPSGTSVGYGRKFISRRPSKIATINIGYADGMPRPYSPNAFVIINGVKAPVAGNVCMSLNITVCRSGMMLSRQEKWMRLLPGPLSKVRRR